MGAAAHQRARPACDPCDVAQAPGYRPLEVEERSALARALAWYDDGMDLADAPHLAPNRRSPHDCHGQRARERATGLRSVIVVGV